MKTSLVNIIILFFGVISVTAQSNEELQSQLDRILSSVEFRNANLSLAVVDLSTHEVIAQERAKKVLIPASSLKLLTTFAGIEVLGEDYNFTTRISYDGYIEIDGTLIGNLYIEGSGDPTLGSSKFDNVLSFDKFLSSVVTAVKEQGITCIDGDIIADESIISTQPVSPSWQWNDLGNYYASGAWGININENKYVIQFSHRGGVGRRPKLASHWPKVPGIKFSNELVVDSAGTGDNAYIFGGPYNYYKRIIGTIPAGDGTFSIKGSIPDPPYFAAYHIQRKLEKSKIKTGEIKTKYVPDSKAANRVSIAKYESPTLKEISRRSNFESNNLFVEAICKMMGLEKRGLASGQNGIAAIKSVMRKYRVNYDGMHLEDGSGLSARNNISSYTLAMFLSKFAQHFGIEKACYYLPKGGYSGTVKSMFGGTKAKGKVWAKSGSMSRIQSYTGYINAKSGKWLSFSIIVNGYDVDGRVIRQKLERLMREIYDHG